MGGRRASLAGLDRPELRVQAAALHELLVAAALDHAALVEDEDPSALRTVERRCAITMVVRSCAMRSMERWMAASVSLSTDDVASSRIRIGGSFITARARETR